MGTHCVIWEGMEMKARSDCAIVGDVDIVIVIVTVSITWQTREGDHNPDRLGYTAVKIKVSINVHMLRKNAPQVLGVTSCFRCTGPCIESTSNCAWAL